jgi:CheY-like chemotaxis protein
VATDRTRPGHHGAWERRRWVLVVDDDRAVVEFVVAALRDEPGLDAVGVRDGARALAVLASVRPDAVLSDLMMPGIDGFELARRVRADPAQAGLCLVAMTATGSAARPVERAVAAGYDGVLLKPFDLDALFAELGRCLGRRAQ